MHLHIAGWSWAQRLLGQLSRAHFADGLRQARFHHSPCLASRLREMWSTVKGRKSETKPFREFV